MSTWFQQHRVEWIAETVLIFGFINRDHISRKFGVSTAQASLDLNLAIQTFPGLLTYNTSAKRYELAADYPAVPQWSPPSVARIRSAMDGDQAAMPATGQPPVGMAAPDRNVPRRAREAWKARISDHDFQQNGPGIVGSDICVVCGREREDHEPAVPQEPEVEPDGLRQWREEQLERVSNSPFPAQPATEAQGIRAAIRFIEKRRDDYVAEHGMYDPATGTMEYPGNGDEAVCEWEEIIDGLEALATGRVTAAAIRDVLAAGSSEDEARQ